MTRTIPFTKNRQVIYDLLSRAKKYHCTVNSIVDLDVTELVTALERVRGEGRSVGFLASLVKATGMVMDRYPKLNHHLFHGLVRKVQVDFEEIVCNLIMLRREAGEIILLPVLIERCHELSVDEIQQTIDYHRRTPLDRLPQVQGLQRLKKLPLPVIKWFSYKSRSDPAFYRKYFGTYGLSPLFSEGDSGVPDDRLGVPSHVVANVGTSFLPSAIAEQPVVVDGQVMVRKMLSMLLAVDHYLIDGHDGLLAMRYLRTLLSDPARLGLSSEAAPASAAGRR